jgi:Icc protein
LFADRDASLRGTVTYSSLQRVLAHIHASSWNADLVALTGDLIQEEHDGRAAYGHLAPLMEALALPILCVPGNHDVRRLMRQVMAGPPFEYCGALERGNWQIVGVDSCKDGSAAGRVSASEITRLRALLEASTADHILICLHHPPVDVGSKWLNSVGLENRAEFLDTIVASGKVRGAIFGHVHQAHDTSHESIRIIGTPSTCRQFAAGSDEFALDDEPPAYRRITLNSDGTIDSVLVQVNS